MPVPSAHSVLGGPDVAALQFGSSVIFAGLRGVLSWSSEETVMACRASLKYLGQVHRWETPRGGAWQLGDRLGRLASLQLSPPQVQCPQSGSP